MTNIRDQVLGMTSASREVMWQLFLNGPTWDGDISSKCGREELFKAGLAWRINGWSFLTKQGVEVALRIYLMDERKERWDRERRGIKP